MNESSNRVKSAVDQIVEARRSRQKITRPLTSQFPSLTVEDAYAIQKAWVDTRRAAGRKVVGLKVGLTSKVMQVEAKLNEPDYGCLIDDEVFENGSEIDGGRFIAPRIELELAFVMKHDLDGLDCSYVDVLRATEYVLPAIELLDSRIERVDPVTKAARTVTDNICDNAANAGLILGGTPLLPTDDLGWVASLCYQNGAVVESGVAAAVMNHPANAVAWLARKLHSHGSALREGDIVLSGSFIRLIDVAVGDTIIGDFGRHGTVSFYLGKNV